MRLETKPEQRSAASEDPLDAAIVAVRAALRGMRFGEIVVVVHEGVVVQIDRTEKVRLRR